MANTHHKDLTGTDLHEPKGVATATSGQVYVADGAASGAWTSLASTFTFPVGGIVDYGGTSAPSGWLLCYGQAISRTTYSSLYTAIGTTYGVGDGSTTFNVPDFRGRVGAGQDDMGGSSANRLTGLTNGVDGDTLGASGGLESFTLATTNIPSHTHTFSATTSSNGAHNHDIDVDQSSSNCANGSSHNSAGSSDTTSTDGAHTHTVSGTTGSAGSTTAMGHIQPTLIVNKIIFTNV